MKNNKQFIDEIYKKYDEYKKYKRKNKQIIIKTFENTAAIFVVLLSSIVVFSQKRTPKVIEGIKNDEVAQIDLDAVGNFENFYNIMKEKNNYQISENQEIKENSNLEVISKSETNSITNIQIENVDEGDIVKTDEKYIYYLSGQKLIILNAENAENSKKVSEINYEDEGFYPVELYVQKNKLVVIGNNENNQIKNVKIEESKKTNDLYKNYNPKTCIIIYDITNREELKEERRVMLEGIYISSMSRMIENNIYFAVTKYVYTNSIENKSLEELDENEYKPKYIDTLISTDEKCIEFDNIYNLDKTNESNYLILVGVNIDNSEEADIQTFLGAGTMLYSSEKNMYIATNKTEYDEYYKIIGSKVNLIKFELKDGKIMFKARGEVDGQVNNQFSMDENDNMFRIATTTGEIWTNQNVSNNLYVLNEKLEQVGKLEGFADEERIYSVRYIGNKAYVVTFKKTDPFWIIDISDSKNPKILGEVQLPGYSVYLHPYDETHIIGFGYETEEKGNSVVNNGLKLVMFDVTECTNPKVLFKIAVGDSKYTYSELLYDHKSAVFSKEKNVMVFPINSSAGMKTNSRAVVYEIDFKNGFSLKGEIVSITNKHEEVIRRIVFVNGNYYTLAYGQIKVANMDTLEVLKVIDI